MADLIGKFYYYFIDLNFFKGTRIYKAEFNKKSNEGNRQKSRSIEPT